MAAPRRWRSRAPGDGQAEDSRADVDETIHQYTISFKDSCTVTSGIHSTHTHTNTHKHAYSPVYEVYLMHQRALPSVREAEKGGGVFFAFILCAPLYDVMCVLAPLISIQLKTTTRPRYTVAFPGGRHRHTVNISCLWRVCAREELGTTWNTVWWLKQVVRNQLEETPGIKGTESTLSLLSLGSHSSERIGDRFGPQKNLSVNLPPVPVSLCSRASVTASAYVHQPVKDAVCLCFIKNLSNQATNMWISPAAAHDTRSGCLYKTLKN